MRAFIVVCLGLFSQIAWAVTYDSLSFFEEPIAFEAGYGVVELRSYAQWAYSSDDNGNAKYDSQEAVANLTYTTQLANDWDISVQYVSDYASERYDSYEDLVRIEVADQWGSIQVGTVSSVLYEQTNRQTAVGLLAVDDDDFTLPMARYGLVYQWQTPATRWLAAIDKDGNVQVGTRWYKPVGGIEYEVSARLVDTELERGDAQGVYKNQGAVLMAQLQRGRWIADVQYLREKLTLLNDNDVTLDLWSAGAHYLFNRWAISFSGQLRENELNDEEREVALGVRYELARGLSLNGGVNIKSSKLFSKSFTSWAGALRYEF